MSTLVGGTKLGMSENKTPKAKVVWWDARRVYVRCHYCEKIHGHGFCRSFGAKQYRHSHCHSQINYGSYEFVFPFDSATGEAWYEINKERALFVAAGEDPEEYFSKWEDSFVPLDVSNRPKWTEGTEMVDFFGDPTRRIDLIVTALVLGQVEPVRHFLDSSPDARLMIHGVYAREVTVPTFDDSDAEDENVEEIPHVSIRTEGKTALFLAAPEKSSEMVKLLLERGADPNVPNIYRRTPLMEAALFGRVESVQLLLEYGAAKDTICMSSGRKRRLAIDFARVLDENSEERFERAGGGGASDI
ncbi:hypothetical protein RB594_006896 [Gaeumannomyces avenae]